MRHRIAVIPGDGIGPEVIAQALRLIDWYREHENVPLETWVLDLGAERYLRDGTTLPGELRDEIASCSAVLVGALGDPRIPDSRHAREILLGMRTGFDLYANVRPAKALCERLVPLKNCHAEQVDFVVFRENTEGMYVGLGGQFKAGTPDEVAINEDVNTRKGVERIVRAAFEYARQHGRRRVHMADKSNAMRHAHELWLRVFELVRKEYPEIEARHVYIDALCLYLVQTPGQFDVIVTNNLFGDIVTDLAAALQGGLGMAASANLHVGAQNRVALFEPVHGSAPELVGKHCANPCGALLSVGLLLEFLGYLAEPQRIEQAVSGALEAFECTPDVGGNLNTEQAGSAVLQRLASA